MTTHTRTYTGPTLAGGTATIVCPPWCTVDHEHPIEGIDRADHADDAFHASETIAIVPPPDDERTDQFSIVPQLRAYLIQHSVDPLTPPYDAEHGPGTPWRATEKPMRPGAGIYLALEDAGDRAVTLDLEGAEQVLAELEEYTEAFRQMRDHLRG
ncbi:DUF6907 domain-containing protein [Streptomyces iconiensis]|uniref:Uncharacterized protein n=1 Tax=Streptomyces iconiensis TaxID=1384038 RepID=A0ABT6ZRT3_9ACTN|nr:hypothetical protein [Streptomyces iconiensis]MDJ1131778.1 hypothetical protein [Streptomyces iconiensis]